MRILMIELEAGFVEAFSDALLEAGAASVEILDADAGSASEQPLYGEPAPQTGATATRSMAPPLSWNRSQLRVLLDGGSDAFTVVTAATVAAGLADTPHYGVQDLPDQDWVRVTQAQFPPFAVGERLWIVPSWHDLPRAAADKEAIVLRIDPGRAFGTGSHATTRLILEWLERELRPGVRVLDYGCGSGILAIAAARLGATQVDAVDIDPQAVETCAANALANGVKLRAALPGDLGAAQYDIVIANILAQPLIDLATLLCERLAPGGRIALSGVLETQAAEVVVAYAPRVALNTGAVLDGWVRLQGERR